MLKKKQKLSQKMMAYAFAVILLPVLVLSTAYYILATERLTDNVAEDHGAVLNAIGESVLDKATMIETSMEMLSQNTDIRRLLTDTGLSLYDQVIRLRYQVQNVIDQTKTILASQNTEIMILSPNSETVQRYPFFFRLAEFEHEPDYLRFQATGNNKAWVGAAPAFPQKLVPHDLNENSMFCYYQNILVGTGKIAGTIKYATNIRRLFSAIDIDRSAGDIYVIQDGKVILSSRGAGAFPEQLDMERKQQTLDGNVYISRRLDRLGVSLIMRVEAHTLFLDALISILPQLLTAIASCILLLAMTQVFLKSVQKRMDQAVNLAKEASNGNMNVSFPDPDETEIGQLVQSFNGLLEQLRGEADARISYEQSEKRAMQLALQYQINPHFLFNTLNWIQMEVELGGDREPISSAITLLGKMLRYNLEENATSTLADEVENVRTYVRLMNMRKHDLIDISFDLEALSMDMELIRFLLQPICENAIQHGLVSGRMLHISVKGWQEKELIHLLVENDGKSIPEDKLGQLGFREQKKRDGVGLANVYARLHLFYGDQASLEVRSEPGMTSVHIQFPKEIKLERKRISETSDSGR